MKRTISISFFALLLLPVVALGQNNTALPNAPSAQTTLGTSDDASKMGQPTTDPPTSTVAIDPSTITAPAFRAGLRMANPPGKGATQYPPEWRQGAEAFGRNYGDALAERASFQTARFVTGAMTREDPRYLPSGHKNILGRSLYALSFTFVDRSDSGHPMPALSNFVGAAAGGFVGNTYLPADFNDVTHAGQRATLRFGFFAAGNLFREFAPQMPRPLRTFFILIAR